MRASLNKWWLLLCMLGAMPGLAHRLPECVTTLVWLEKEQRLEITHRLHRHDAQLALESSSTVSGTEPESLEFRARTALYVESRFGLRGDQTLALTLLGAEFDGDHLLVYQEYEGPLPKALWVRSETLLERNPEQINTVLLNVRGTQRQLALGADAGWVAVTL